MKKALALRDFGIAYDGIRVTPVAKGDTIDVPDDAAEGLEKEGYITFDLPSQSAAPKPETEEPKPETPEVPPSAETATEEDAPAEAAPTTRRRR